MIDTIFLGVLALSQTVCAALLTRHAILDKKRRAKAARITPYGL